MHRWIFTRRPKIGLLVAALWCVVLSVSGYAKPAAEAEQLIVFEQPDISPVATSSGNTTCRKFKNWRNP